MVPIILVHETCKNLDLLEKMLRQFRQITTVLESQKAFSYSTCFCALEERLLGTQKNEASLVANCFFSLCQVDMTPWNLANLTLFCVCKSGLSNHAKDLQQRLLLLFHTHTRKPFTFNGTLGYWAMPIYETESTIPFLFVCRVRKMVDA